MVGGDQVAESLASITKSQLRRHGLSRNVSDPIEHRNVLSVHYIHKNPGLSSIMSALARFRKYAETSYTPVSRVFSNAPWEWKNIAAEEIPLHELHIQEWKNLNRHKKTLTIKMWLVPKH